MSSLSAIMNGAVTSMHASQLGISIASNNISNAQDPNYTRQRLDTAPLADGDALSGNGGVQIIGIEALRDKLVETQLLQENSSSAGANLLNQTLNDLQVQFNDTNGTGLLNSISNFFNSFQT